MRTQLKAGSWQKGGSGPQVHGGGGGLIVGNTPVLISFALEPAGLKLVTKWLLRLWLPLRWMVEPTLITNWWVEMNKALPKHWTCSNFCFMLPKSLGVREWYTVSFNTKILQIYKNVQFYHWAALKQIPYVRFLLSFSHKTMLLFLFLSSYHYPPTTQFRLIILQDFKCLSWNSYMYFLFFSSSF